MRLPYSLSPRSVITALALAGMALSQTSCGMIAHNVGRLMSIPASVLGEESVAAFITMFRKTLGAPPKAWLRET